MARLDLKAMAFEQIEALVGDLGWPAYRATQILRWIYQRGAREIREMTDLPLRARQALAERATISQLERLEHLVSEDGTEKFLFGLPGLSGGGRAAEERVVSLGPSTGRPQPEGSAIETVVIPEGARLTLCVSSQVGCGQACAFCYTGIVGLRRHLQAHEIVDQVIAVQRTLAGVRGYLRSGWGDGHPAGRRLTNIVLMGQGEPLANLPHVLEALRRMTSKTGLAISPRRITLSTSGLIPQMDELAREAPRVNLAVSLNATTQAVRDRLMPLHHAFPLEDLIAACRRYPLAPRQRLTFEYVLLKGVNDQPTDARRLVRLVQRITCRINLIPFNEFPGDEFRRPDDEQVLAFQRILREASLPAFIRKSRGRDILAACGQLAAVAGRPA